MNEWEVGEGVTLRYVSDCYPYTVVGTANNGKTVLIQEDRAVRQDDRGTWTEMQDYIYERNTFGGILTFTLRKNGAWRRKGEDMRHTGASISHGRRKYLDPSF